MQPFDIASLADYRHCYFVLRSDHAIKPGGDVDLARQIAGAAAAVGAGVSIVGSEDLPASLSAADLLFLFNIDRPHDAATALRHAHPDARVLLYPLHHPDAGVTKYLRQVGGAKRVLSALAGGRPDRYEALVDAAKAIRARDLDRLTTAWRRQAAIRTLIERCELVVTSEQELAEIAVRFGAPGRPAWLLPHPVAPYVPSEPDAVPQVLIAGRIEPRKNQLAALQTLTALRIGERGHRIALLGGSGSDAGYFDVTVAFARDNDITYIDQLSKAAFFAAVSNATLVLNASFFEVTSLIDLYAIDNSVPLVTTIHGYYPPAPRLRLVDPLGWGASPAGEIVDAVEAMLALRGAGVTG